MKFAVCILSLGYTRLAGITLYDSVYRDFTETTPKIARELIDKGLVKGVKWKDEGFVPDEDFNMQDILVKSAVGKYRPLLHEIPGEVVNSTYMVVRVLETNKGKLYEIVSNKCQRVKITEDKLRGLNAIGNVAGVIITDDEVKICDGVVIEKRTYPTEAEHTDMSLSITEDIKETLESDSKDDTESHGNDEEPQTLENIFEGLNQQTEDKQEEPAEQPQSMEEVFEGLDEIVENDVEKDVEKAVEEQEPAEKEQKQAGGKKGRVSKKK